MEGFTRQGPLAWRFSENLQTIDKDVKRGYQRPKIFRKLTLESPKWVQKSIKMIPGSPLEHRSRPGRLQDAPPKVPPVWSLLGGLVAPQGPPQGSHMGAQSPPNGRQGSPRAPKGYATTPHGESLGRGVPPEHPSVDGNN